MADDEVTTSTESDGEPPPPPSLAERLALPAEELAEDLRSVSIDDVRTLLVTEREAAATTARQAAAAEQARQREAEKADQQRFAAVGEDIHYYEDLRARLNSPDDAVRTNAESERRTNDDRYVSGAAAARQRADSELQTRVLGEHYRVLMTELAGTQPDFVNALAGLLPAHGNNTLAAAIAYGRSQGELAALERGRDEGARSERIKLGLSAAPALNEGTPMATGNYGDPAWVKSQMDRDPEWALAKSADGKQTNLQRATDAGALKRAAEQMRNTSR